MEQNHVVLGDSACRKERKTSAKYELPELRHDGRIGYDRLASQTQKGKREFLNLIDCAIAIAKPSY